MCFLEKWLYGILMEILIQHRISSYGEQSRLTAERALLFMDSQNHQPGLQ